MAAVQDRGTVEAVGHDPPAGPARGCPRRPIPLPRPPFVPPALNPASSATAGHGAVGARRRARRRPAHAGTRQPRRLTDLIYVAASLSTVTADELRGAQPSETRRPSGLGSRPVTSKQRAALQAVLDAGRSTEINPDDNDRAARAHRLGQELRIRWEQQGSTAEREPVRQSLAGETERLAHGAEQLARDRSQPSQAMWSHRAERPVGEA
jgi:hypothetical protein